MSKNSLKKHTIIRYVLIVIAISCGILSLNAQAEVKPSVNYEIEFLPDQKSARVKLTLDKAHWVKRLKLKLKGYQITQEASTGELKTKNHQWLWYPNTQDQATLQYVIKIPRKRVSGGYDAQITSTWALMRAERLVPPIALVRALNTEPPKVTIRFKLPKSWTSVNTGWQYQPDPLVFEYEQLQSKFPRLKGWLIAGQLGTRKEQLKRTFVVVSAPQEQDFRQLQMTSFLTYMWPSIDSTFPNMPHQLLVTGAHDPMWRGGLSSPTSLYIHAARPLVGENGTSTLLHELFHVLSSIHGKLGHDWIAEGWAEYYSVEWLYRAGAYTKIRRDKVFESLIEVGKPVKRLINDKSTGPITARAAVLFRDLDDEIKAVSKGRYTLDHLLQKLLSKADLELEDLKAGFKALTGQDSKVLKASVLDK